MNLNKEQKYFNEGKRIELWEREEHQLKSWFGLALNILKSAIEYDSTEAQLKSVYRLNIGYMGVGKQSGLYSGLITKNAIGLKSNKYTNDHWLGATEIGRQVHEAFEKNNFDIDYMVNVWLYDNLWLWSTIRVTKWEHRSMNIGRKGYSIEEKLNFGHYGSNVSPIVFQ
jgi:hypothetical protein